MGKVEVVDTTKGESRPRDPELDALMKYLSEIAETVAAETDNETQTTLLNSAINELCPHVKGMVEYR